MEFIKQGLTNLDVGLIETYKSYSSKLLEESFEEEYSFVCSFYINPSRLKTQLQLLKVAFGENEASNINLTQCLST